MVAAAEGQPSERNHQKGGTGITFFNSGLEGQKQFASFSLLKKALLLIQRPKCQHYHNHYLNLSEDRSHSKQKGKSATAAITAMIR